MRYMMLIKHTEAYRGMTIPPALGKAMEGFMGEFAKRGRFIEGAGLASSKKGHRITLRDRQLQVVDGPFTEAKELVGGYMIIDAESGQEALGAATTFMDLHRIHWPEFEGECELRQFDDGEHGPA